jgi:hypothetical protein
MLKTSKMAVAEIHTQLAKPAAKSMKIGDTGHRRGEARPLGPEKGIANV